MGSLLKANTTILDTRTGLNWLPITATEYMSLNQVVAGTLPGGIFYGFRFATTEEIKGLFQDAFGVSSGSFAYDSGYAFMKLFGYDLGSLYPDDPGYGPHSANLSAPFNNGMSNFSKPLGPNDIVGVATVGIQYFRNANGPDTSSGECSIGQTSAGNFESSDPEVSHGWLVAAIPAPGNLHLVP